MATLYEYYNTGYDWTEAFYDEEWLTQTFTPQATHTITSVKLMIYRSGSPGTITVGIRATDVNGKPTEDDLCSGTTNGNTLTTSSPGEWREITLGDGYQLQASTKYAIVIRITGGSGVNCVTWSEDKSSPTYTGGSVGQSFDYGVSWQLDGAMDFMFEEWGESGIISPFPSHFRV